MDARNLLRRFYLISRTESMTEFIKTNNGKVTDGNLTPTLLPGYTDLIVKPSDKDGNPIQGAYIILKCGSPPRRYSGTKQNDGTYVFKNAIPQSGQKECTMIIKAPG